MIENNEIKSFVDIINAKFENNDAANGDFSAKIIISYYKSHIPYPVKNTEHPDNASGFATTFTPQQIEEELTNKCTKLETVNNSLKTDLDDAMRLYQNSLYEVNELQKLCRIMNYELTLIEQKNQLLQEKTEKKNKNM